MAFATTRQLRDLTERVEELQKLVQSIIPSAVAIYSEPEQEVMELAEDDGEYEKILALLDERDTALLEDAGYTSLTQLKNTTASDLTAIVGIGAGVVKRIQDGKK